MILLVTGGRGFIGSHFVELALEKKYKVIDIDKMNYASQKKLPFDNDPNYTFIHDDIHSIKSLPLCDIIVNFAAESHVDNSINASYPFIESNILGVWNLLELLRGKQEYNRPLFFHISTDEVYGDSEEAAHEDYKLNPSNPYSASKASAELLIKSYYRTYGINYMITRSSNNYGPRQYHEKLIPKTIHCIENKKKIPLHGDGSYLRDWIYVKDNVEAIMFLIEKNIKNDIYNIACRNHIKNIDVVKEILKWYNLKDDDQIEFVENRWGQDLHYNINNSKILSLGWQPKFPEGIYKWF